MHDAIGGKKKGERRKKKGERGKEKGELCE
jgi:hypothetical protein